MVCPTITPSAEDKVIETSTRRLARISSPVMHLACYLPIKEPL